MNNEFLKAADDAKRLLRGFAAIGEVAAVFENAGSAIQAKDEAEKALAGLKDQIAVARSDLAAAKDAAAAERAVGKAKAEEAIAKAQSKAADILLDADHKAQQAIAAATAQVDATVARAAVVKNETEAMMRDRDALAAEVVELEKRAEKARTYLARLQA